MDRLKRAEQSIGYTYQNRELLKTALTHSSYANEKRVKCNERLEFLGDSVLSVIVSDYIFKRLTKVDEGVLTKLRASLVCEQSLAEVANRIHLGEYIYLGHGEELTGGRERASVVSDAFEAVLASVYLDGGIETARAWLLNLMREDIEQAAVHGKRKDYKTTLQEKCQKGSRGRVTYRLLRETGMDHNKQFFVQAYIDDMPAGKGQGGTKKEAEQQAARETLEGMGCE